MLARASGAVAQAVFARGFDARDNCPVRWASSLAAACAVGACAASVANAASSVRIELRGFGQSEGLTAGCPAGQTYIRIVGTSRSVLDCVTSARKLAKAGLDPWRIIETVRATTPLAGGTLRTIETQTFTFTRAGTSTASFRGRVIGGTGRYSGASGAVSGGGVGRNGVALWRLTYELR